MDNISLSLPRRSFSSSTPFTSHKSVYDDVFGGPPKLGLPTLAPRCEDYSEIFGGFHTSQSSSIPVLHLPLIASDDSNLHIDIDYNEVFGGHGGFDYTTSLQDLVGSSGGYDSDSSGEPWSPVQSGSFSGELYPVVGPDKSQRLSDGDSLQSLENIDNQNASYSKSCHMSAETVLTASSHVANVSAIPGYAFSLYESPVSRDGEDEHHFMGVTDNINHSREFGERLMREKQYKCSSNSSQGTSDTRRNDYKPEEKHVSSSSLGDKPFVTVSDISLRTKPSQLPPPSRPPPVLVDKRRAKDKQNSELKPCQRYAIDRVADNISPLFFDMEIDGTISAEGRATGNKNIKSNHQGTKEPAEKQYFHSPSAAKVDEKANETVRETIDIEDENLLQSCSGKTTFSVPVVEENIESIKSTERTSVPLGVRCYNNGAYNPSEAISWREATGYFEVNAEAKCNENGVEVELKQKDSPKRMNIEKMNGDSQKPEQTSGEHEQKVPMEEFQRIFEDVNRAETRKLVQERMEAEGTEMFSGGVSGKHSGNRPEGTYNQKKNGVILKDAKEYEDSGNESYIAAFDEKSVDILFDCEKNMEAGKMIVNEYQASASGKALEQATNDRNHKLVHEMDVIEKINQDFSKNDNEFIRSRMAETQVDNVEEAFETPGNVKLSIDTSSQEELIKHADEIGPIGRNGHDSRELEWDLDSHILIDGDELKVLEGGCEVDEVIKTKVSENPVDIQILKYNHKVFSSSENGDLRNRAKGGIADESETGTVETEVLGRFHEFSENKDKPQDINFHGATNNPVKSPYVPKQMSDSQVCGSGMGAADVMSGKISSALAYSHGEGLAMSGVQFVKRVNINETCYPHQMITESIKSQGKMEGVPSCLKHNNAGLSSRKEARSQQTERKDSIMKSNLAEKDQKVGERIRRETAPENERMRKIEEEREREREREKDRMAVDKAALEARERSYFEVRDRADRAAVERAATEARQRALAEAQERLEKASTEARIRADRAAVERATAEARQRAAEKLMAQKAAYDSYDPVERYVPDRFSASSRSTDTRQSYLSSDIHFQGTGVSNRLRYPYSSAHDGAESESPQRCKARLERYRRTAERAANALAEKNRRDLLAQREREERTRVAEALDVEVKRWSSGKEGNLRALLSTLQYILGPDSGWHPVSLTEVITCAAVKKAYRRATLCVHPDKLQQRGATIQQKYICEKVFDLLKEAWNKFNSEER